MSKILKIKAAFMCAGFSFGIGAALAADPVESGPRQIVSITQNGAETIFELAGAKIVAGSSCTNKFRIDPNDPDSAWKTQAVSNAQASSSNVVVTYMPDSTACNVTILAITVEGA